MRNKSRLYRLILSYISYIDLFCFEIEANNKKVKK